jgi:hypothetical protein
MACCVHVVYEQIVNRVLLERVSHATVHRDVWAIDHLEVGLPRIDAENLPTSGISL